METKPTKLYCAEETDHQSRPYLSYFFSHVVQVKMCMDSRRPLPIYETEVSAGDDPNGYWGWWDAERQEFCFVFVKRLLVEVCFPYGSKAEEERGRGKLMPVRVTILRKVEL